MARKVVRVELDTELARTLEEATEDNVVFETSGTRFRVIRNDVDPFR